VKEIKNKFEPDPELKLMEQVVQVLRYHHYSYRTEKVYCNLIVKFLKFFNYDIHPKEMGKKEIEQFLSHMATHKKVSSSTQRQATAAIFFLFNEVLHMDIDKQIQPIKAYKKNPLPVVLTMDEVKDVISQLSGNNLLWLPDALSRKFPNASKEFQWQYLFPSHKRSIDPRSGICFINTNTTSILVTFIII